MPIVLNLTAPPVFETRDRRAVGTDTCGVVAAWIVVVLLTLGTAVSVVFDHMVTIAAPTAAAVAGHATGVDPIDGREPPDSLGARAR